MTASFAETVKKKLRALAGTSVISDVDLGFQTLAEDVETKTVLFSEGLEVERPFPNRNRLYYATDTGQLWHGDGSEWQPVQLGGLPVSTLSIGGAQADVSITKNVDYTPNPSRPTFVCGWASQSGTSEVSFTVNERQVLRTATSAGTVTFGFIVPAGYRFRLINGVVGFASYTTL